MSSNHTDDSPFLTVEQAARYLHMTAAYLRDSVIRKRIPHRRAGSHRLLFIQAELDRWLKVQTRIELARLAKRRGRTTRRKSKSAAA